MKPIKLTMQAFESYYQKQEIDFEKLSTNGIFLICGNTGSGKTAIFDAISFALFGELSEPQRTDKDQIKTLDAPSSITSYVILEFEEKGKRYRISRYPSQTILSKRKEIQLNSQVTLSFLDDSFADITSITQANKKILDIIGLDKDQFFQVSMIAQGDFSKILTSNTKDRQEILRKLFNTYIFQDFTDKLKEHLKISEDKQRQATDKLESCYSSMDFAAEDIENSKLFTSNLEREAYIEKCQKKYRDLFDTLNAKKKDLDTKIGSLTIESQLCKDNETYKALLEKEKSKLDNYSRELATLGIIKGNLSKKATLIEKSKEEVTLLNDKLSDYEKLDTFQRQISELKNTIEVVSRKFENLKKIISDNHQKKASLSLKQTSVEEQLSKESELKSKLVVASNNYQNALKEKDDASKARNELAEYQRKNELFHKKDSEYNTLYTKQSEIEKAFYDSMGGFLASSLVEGSPCPVCGSTIHPYPATRKDNDVTKEEMEIAKKEATEALKNRNKVSVDLESSRSLLEKYISDSISFFASKNIILSNTDFTTSVEGITKAADSLSSTCFSEKNKLEKQCQIFDSLHSDEKSLKDQIKNIEESENPNQEKLTQLVSEKSKAEADLKNYSFQELKLKQNLSFSSKAEAQRRINDVQTSIQDFENEVKDNEQKLLSANSQVASCEGAIKSYSASIASYKGRNKEEIDSDLSQENSLKDPLADQINKTYSSLSSLSKGINDYRNLVNQSKESVDEYTRVSKLSFVFGADVRNRNGLTIDRGVSLETYVLSYYLDRILEKASFRFKSMTGGRYLLLRKADSSKGTSQQGLDIDVLDLFTNKERRASTLSGGETFMASLSLALGLSDYVKEVVGNKRIEMLFIDEGFGTLDSESLAKVVNTLTSLVAQESTVIGLISHVNELEEFFDSKLLVSKDKLGHSTCKNSF